MSGNDNTGETPKFKVLEGGGKAPEKFPPEDLADKARELRDHAHALLANRPDYQRFYGTREKIAGSPNYFRFPKPGKFNGIHGELRTELTPWDTIHEAIFYRPQGIEKITLREPVPGMRDPNIPSTAVIDYQLTNKDGIPIVFQDGPDAYRKIKEAFDERYSWEVTQV